MSRRRRQGGVSQAKRRCVWREANGRCQKCHVACVRVDGPTLGTIDHIVPVSRGGSHRLANLQLLCKRCNTRKGAKLPDVSKADPSRHHDLDPYDLVTAIIAHTEPPSKPRRKQRRRQRRRPA